MYLPGVDADRRRDEGVAKANRRMAGQTGNQGFIFFCLVRTGFKSGAVFSLSPSSLVLLLFYALRLRSKRSVKEIQREGWLEVSSYRLDIFVQ